MKRIRHVLLGILMPGAVLAVTVSGALGAPVGASANYPSVVEADHPYAYYQLAEAPGAKVAADSSGNGHNGTYATCVQLGKPGPIHGYTATAALFQNQPGCDVSYVPSAGYRGSYSVEAWIRTTSTSKNAQTFLDTRVPDQTGKPSSGEYSFDLKLQGTSNPAGQAICFDTGDGSLWLDIYGGVYHGCVPFGFRANTWYYVAYTVNWPARTSTVYVNGAVLGQVALMSYGHRPLFFNASHPLTIGASPRFPSATNGENFEGKIGQAAFYTSLLSASQIAAHYQAGKAA